MLLTTIIAVSVSAANAQGNAAPEASEPASIEGQPEPLEPARRALSEAQFDKAKKLLSEAHAAGELDPSNLAELYRLQGETLAAMGNESGALVSFRSLLALEPDSALGDLVSPKITAVLEAARESMDGQFLVAEHTVDIENRRIELVISSDPLAMIVGARVFYSRVDGSEAELIVDAKVGPSVIDVPSQATGPLALVLTDSRGNRARAWSLPAFPDGAAIFGGSEGSASSRPALWSRWWLWAGAAGVVGITGTAFGLASRSAQSDLDSALASPEQHFYSDAKAIENKAQARATVANLAFVGAVGLGAVAGLLFYREGSRESSIALTPSADGHSATMQLRGRF